MFAFQICVWVVEYIQSACPDRLQRHLGDSAETGDICSQDSRHVWGGASAAEDDV